MKSKFNVGEIVGVYGNERFGGPITFRLGKIIDFKLGSPICPHTRKGSTSWITAYPEFIYKIKIKNYIACFVESAIMSLSDGEAFEMFMEEQ